MNFCYSCLCWDMHHHTWPNNNSLNSVYVNECFVYMHLCTVCTVPPGGGGAGSEGSTGFFRNWTYKPLWASRWVLGTKPRSSGRSRIVLNCCTVSSASTSFYCVLFYWLSCRLPLCIFLSTIKWFPAIFTLFRQSVESLHPTIDWQIFCGWVSTLSSSLHPRFHKALVISPRKKLYFLRIHVDCYTTHWENLNKNFLSFPAFNHRQWSPETVLQLSVGPHQGVRQPSGSRDSQSQSANPFLHNSGLTLCS